MREVAGDVEITVEWIAYDDAGGREDIGTMGGWVEGEPWDEYLAKVHKEVRPHYEALRRAIVARGLREGGDWHQTAEDGVPLFSDGTVATFSYRGWGDLLAAIWNSEPGAPAGGYGYMDFYMSGWGRGQEVAE